jgi:formiminotetrahydrofolate cyclodeaminase
MASKKAPKKFVEKKDAKTELQMSIQAAINSNYSLLIPCVDGNFVYVRNPIAGKTRHFETNKQEFVDYIKELTEIGLGEKLEKDFNELVAKDSEHWTKVVKFLKEQKAFEVAI